MWRNLFFNNEILHHNFLITLQAVNLRVFFNFKEYWEKTLERNRLMLSCGPSMLMLSCGPSMKCVRSSTQTFGSPPRQYVDVYLSAAMALLVATGPKSGIFEGRGGFFKVGHKFLAVRKVKVKCKHESALLPKITNSFKFK